MNDDGLYPRVALELYQQGGDGDLLGQVKLDVDWDMAIESCRFACARRDRDSIAITATGAAIVPQWHPKLGKPYVHGFSIRLPGAPADLPDRFVPTTYLEEMAQQAAKALVKSGKLADGDHFRYLVCAFPPAQEAPQARTGLQLAVEDVSPPLPLLEGSVESLLEGALPYGRVDEGDFPVVVPRHIIDEAISETLRAKDKESGGTLIGYLRWDPTRREIVAQVTAQVIARHAKHELTRLEFTPQTWSDVDATLALRKRNEVWLGWWHSHPARQWCKNCPEENRRVCKLSGEFFSDHDVAFHRAVFSRAYNVALVISDSYASGLTWPMFGWRQGMVQQRGYYIQGARADGTSLPTTPMATQGDEDGSQARFCKS